MLTRTGISPAEGELYKDLKSLPGILHSRNDVFPRMVKMNRLSHVGLIDNFVDRGGTRFFSFVEDSDTSGS